jgi:hypothetical protein
MEDAYECPICFETDDLKHVEHIWCTLPCTHILCYTCLGKLDPARCPMCRKELDHLLPRKEDSVQENSFEYMVQMMQNPDSYRLTRRFSPRTIRLNVIRASGEELTDE